MATPQSKIFKKAQAGNFKSILKKQKEPKIKLSFDGCYNYEKLKKEGLVDDKESYDKDPDGQIFDDYTDPYGGH